MKKQHPRQVPVAIIGIGCMFAKSSDQKSFLNLLMRGVDAITDPPETHQYLNDYYDTDPKRPDHIYCNRGGYLPSIDFDPSEFGIPPTALEATDTSQLLGLVVAKQALDDAGYGTNGRTFDREKTSVILGVTGTQELVIPLGARLGHPLWRRALADAGVPTQTAEDVIQRIGEGYVPWQESSFPGLLGNVVAGRIANRLDLGGTNCAVDAACASSMSAIHMALMELASGRSDMALTGGVDTISDAFMHMCFSRTQILSKSGNIRPFSKDADGTVLGEGIGMLVLKRLDDAKRDGDRIYAVIKGLGSASDGKSQSIYAPRQSGQAMALRRAYQNAGLAPENIGLLEAHGTGTRVGDQVEFKALCEVFGSATASGNRCALGSVKSNIGHTKAAAGTAGLIKAALCLYHKVLMPTLKADPADPNLDVDNSPFFINHDLKPWVIGEGQIRRAGVSAFGFGGSNFHAVLEEFEPVKHEPAWDGSVEIAAFGAESKKALAAAIDQWCEQISQSNEGHKVARSAAHSRLHFDPKSAYRLVMVLDPAGDEQHVLRRCRTAREKLADYDDRSTRTLTDGIFIGSGDPPGALAFLFPGQGSQYVGMGRDLVCGFPEVLEVFQAAEGAIRTEEPLSAYIYPKKPDDPAEAEAQLRSTDVAQPAIGAVSAAMLALLKIYGIEPTAVCGHSYGELVALHAAGRIDRNALWRLSEARGKLMAEAGRKGTDADSGSMLAVRGPIEALEAIVAELPEGIVLANRNSPHQGVLSGPTPAIETAEQICKAKGYHSVRLPVAAAFHTRLVSAAQTPFQAMVDRVQWAAEGPIAVMSNTLGGRYPDDVVQARQLLGKQLALPVDFISNIETLYANGIRTFVEVGPKSVLTRLVEKILDGRHFHALALDRSAGRGFGVNDLAQTIAQLAALGYPVKLQRWEKALPDASPKRMRIPLSGANYKTPRTVRPPVAQEENLRPPVENPAMQPQISPADRNTRAAAPSEFGCDAKPTIAPPTTIQQRRPDPANGRHPENIKMDFVKRDYLNHALATVQQGLASMQALQSQTSEAHQKYLEAQTEASRTLQQMLQSTQQLAAVALGNDGATADRDSIAAPEIQPDPAPPSRVPLPSLSQAAPIACDNPAACGTPRPVISPQRDERVQERILENSDAKLLSIQKALVTIVSQLTGYPDEMLGMEMDIESDLGIDSIKRVEILSALEDQMPDLPRVTPDMMGTLKTLGQICDYLGSGIVTASAPQEAVQPPPSLAGTAAEEKEGGDPSAIESTLLQIVAALTGYPQEMLGMEMDIESDLGIDSIKRVEILSAMEDQMPNLPRVTPDMVGTLKTLGQICTYLAGPVGTTSSQPVAAAVSPSLPQHRSQGAVAECAPRPVPRHRIDVVDLPSQPKHRRGHPIRMLAQYPIGLAASEDEFGDALHRSMTSAGFPVIRLVDPEQMTSNAKLAGLVIVAPQDPIVAFQWAQICAPGLHGAAHEGCDAFFYTVTRLDGAFGFNKTPLTDPEQGALAGLVKTAGIEWPAIYCAALDVAPNWPDVSAAAAAVWDEIAYRSASHRVEIGLGPDRRVGLQLVASTSVRPRKLDLGTDDVVVVTGGARGVTAAAATALAMHAPCRLVLLGRSPQPETEPEWLAGITDEAHLKKAILTNASKDSPLSPRELEATYRHWMANRQILSTIDRLKTKGLDVNYLSLDVRDSTAVCDAMTKIRSKFGSIKALIHGAGILEDRMIVDKKLDQFSVVYDTKVKGLNAILHAIRTDDLKYLVLFSSISARMGNTGQADYAMANEALNKIAVQQSHERPGCKVVSINWGPWDGGMVTPSLKRVFQSAGICLISIEDGANALVAEMGEPTGGPIEVVLGGPLPSAPGQPDEVEKQTANICNATESMALAAKRDIDIRHYPILQSHLLDGHPVVPFALITEWLAHGALHANPGLSLYGIDNLRLFKGIVLDEQIKSIRLMAANAKRRDGMYAVEVEVRDGKQNGSCQIHSSATALLADRLPAPPSFEENGHFKETPYNRSLAEIYEHILFHGDALRGIQKIIHLSDKGLTARVRSAPAPDQWLHNPMRSRWIADPLVMDCAFQMAIIWCYEHQRLVSLPSYAAAYRQYRERFPTQGITAVLEVVRATDRKLTADFTFLDEDKKVIACMTGYEAVMDQNLFKAFGVKAA